MLQDEGLVPFASFRGFILGKATPAHTSLFEITPLCSARGFLQNLTSVVQPLAELGSFLTKVSLCSSMPSQNHPVYRIHLIGLIIEDIMHKKVCRLIDWLRYSL